MLICQAQAGSSKIPVGQVIAILAEEGDDLASIEVPKDLGPEGESSSSSSSADAAPAPEPASQPKAKQPAQQQSGAGSTGQQAAKAESASSGHHAHKKISHPKPLFPSVSRL